MTGCENLCTADKCAELEAKIQDLENKLKTIQNDFDNHINQDIPDAHDYDLNLDNYVTKDEFQEHQNTEIPDAHNYQPAINLDVFSQENGEYVIKIQIDGESDQDSFSVTQIDDYVTQAEFQTHLNTDIPDAHGYQPPEYEPDLEITNFLTGDGSTRVVVSLDGRDVSTILDNNQDISGDITSYLNNQDFYFSIDELSNNDYRFNITFGDKSRSEILDLPSSFSGGGEIELPPQTVNITGTYDQLNNNLDITVSVNGKSSTVSINLDDMPFNEIITCLTEIKQALEELEPTEVVTLVASEKALHRVKDKVLILHFVTLDNYPKRQRNSSYRPVQIPAPKQSYTWEHDFESLIWEQGNQYAEMKLEGWKTKVSGWFANAQAANSYFDAVLGLTTATEENRIISNHSNPQTNIPTRTTRPYRAFISQVNSSGVAECLAKYQPPTNNNEQ